MTESEILREIHDFTRNITRNMSQCQCQSFNNNGRFSNLKFAIFNVERELSGIEHEAYKAVRKFEYAIADDVRDMALADLETYMAKHNYPTKGDTK